MATGKDAKITHGKWSKLPCQNPRGMERKISKESTTCITISMFLILRLLSTIKLPDGHQPNSNLGGGFKYFLFSPLLGEMIQFD